jgi:hypothetical protein
MRYLNPGQDQKARIVCQQMKISLPRFGIPANEAIAACQVTRRRKPRQTGNRLTSGGNQILKTLSDSLLITEIVILLDQAVEQSSCGVRRTC